MNRLNVVSEIDGDITEETGPRVAGTRRGWKLSAWHGITLNTPSLWNMVGYGGDYTAGNIRLDNAGDSTSDVIGVELRWTFAKTAPSAADLGKRVTQYLQAVEKEARRSKLRADTKSRNVSSEMFDDRKHTQAFHWKSDRRGHGRIWYCSTCKRIVIAQVISTAKHDISGIAQDVLTSINCHPADAAWTSWSLYDLFTEIPADYALKRQPQLMNIYVQLNFERAKSQDLISVEQWSAADLQLRGHYLDQWFRAKSGNAIDHLKYAAVEGAANGHAALWITGKRSGPLYWLTVGLPQLSKLQWPTRNYSACLWECADSNKVFLIQANSRKIDAGMIRQIVERTRCH